MELIVLENLPEIQEFSRLYFLIVCAGTNKIWQDF